MTQYYIDDRLSIQFLTFLKFINAYKLDIPYIEYADFYYLINMFYSDYKRVFEKLGINNTEAYIKFADAAINDPDAPEGAIYTKYKSTH